MQTATPTPASGWMAAGALAAVLPVAEAPHLSHLATETVAIAVLASTVLLLFGVLFRLRQLRIALERKSRELETSERRMRLMGDNLPNAALFQLVFPPDGPARFDYLSKGYELALGIARAPVLADARLALDQVYEKDVPLLREAFRRGREALEPAQFEIRALDGEGKLKWLHVSAVPHRDGGVLAWDGFLQDISLVKRVEDALVEENRNLQNLFETIEDLMVVCDMDGRLLHTNPSVEQRLGHAAGELRQMSIFELYPEGARGEIYRLIARMQSEKSTSTSLPLRTRDGQEIPVDMNVFQGWWKNRQAIFCVARDVAGRQKAENALRESQNMLQTIMDTIPMSVFWKDKDSVYLGCNKDFARESGFESAVDVVGKTPFDLFDEAAAAEVVERDRKVIESNQPFFNQLISHTRGDGSVGWREISKIPLRDGQRRAVGVIGVWRDVTEQNRAEERLKRTLEDMERFNQLMRGRERRTLELKAEINALMAELGRPKKYRTTTDEP